MADTVREKGRPRLCAAAQGIALFASAADSFTKSELSVANYIAEHRTAFIAQTITELAAAAKVSEITVSRFCKKLRLPGLQALKIKLSALQPRQSAAGICREDDVKTLSEKIFRRIEQGLNDTLQLMDFAALERAARLIVGARRLLFYGSGSSFAVCLDLSTRFARFGISCEATADVHQQMTLSAVCREGTVIAAVSYSGSSMGLVDALNLGRAHGAKVILFTSHQHSPAAAAADEVLLGLGPELKVNEEASTSRLIYLAVADVLYSRCAFLLGETFSENLGRMREAIARVKA